MQPRDIPAVPNICEPSTRALAGRGALLAVALLVPGALTAQDALPARSIAAMSYPAVVSVQAFREGESISLGSGFVIREDGVVVTNLHVVQGADSVSIELESGEIYDNVYVLGHDARRDLIVLQIPAAGLPTLAVGDDQSMEVGDTVYVVGNPLGFERTFSDGLLSAKRVEEGVVYLQITAPISEGSSGGPVLNAAGQVIGVTTSTVQEGQNLNIAVPARYAGGLLALAEEPVAFEAIAAELPPPVSDPIAVRASETAALMETLPAEVRASIEAMQPWEQQVTVRLIELVAISEQAGWEQLDDGEVFYLGAGAVESVRKVLRPGSYLAVGVCDDDCADLDMVVVGPDGDQVGEDLQTDATPVVQFTVDRRGRYAMSAKMVSCATDTCLSAVQLLRAPQ